MRQIFFALISTVPALPSFTALSSAPQLLPCLWVQLFFLSLDGDGSSSHRCTPNASPSCLSPYLCLSCIFAISLSLDGAGSPCHRHTPNTSPSRPLSMPLIIFAPLSLLRRLSFSSRHAERCPLGSRKGTGSHPNEPNSAKAECSFSTLLFTCLEKILFFASRQYPFPL